MIAKENIKTEKESNPWEPLTQKEKLEAIHILTCIQHTTTEESVRNTFGKVYINKYSCKDFWSIRASTRKLKATN